MKRALPAVVLLLMATAGARAAGGDGVADSLLQVIVTYQQYDPFAPWQKTRPGLRQGYGVVVAPGRVLTSESLVRNQTMVELRRATTGEKIPAALEMSDDQVDLALLRVADERAAAAIPALALGTNVVPKHAKVTILQFDETRGVQRGDADVVQINMAELPNAPYAELTYSLLTDLTVNGVGAAVVQDSRLCGLIIGNNSGERIGFMLPAPVLRRFLDDVATPPYAGIPIAGFRWKTLVDPAQRAYLHVDHPGQGILVLSCIPGTGAANVLKPGDVIVQWGGFNVDNLGFYEDPTYGRLSLSYLIRDKGEPGKAVPVTLLRAGQQQSVQLELATRNDRAALLPENVGEERAEYLVEGGLVIRELDGFYLRARGGDWKSKTDARITNLYLTRRDNPERPGDRLVVLASVQPDPINIGYQEFNDQIIEKVNGKPVRNIADVFRIKDEDGHVVRLSLRSVGVDLVLDRTELDVANRRIAATYRIPELEYRKKAAQ